MKQGYNNALRTRVYIDGYNLYYGCLKNSPHKWLNILALVENILPSVLCELNGIPAQYSFVQPTVKFFTAPILTAFAKSDDSVSCQSQYHSALRQYLGSSIEIIMGYPDARPTRAYAWQTGKAARECEQLDIWKLEEKQSDVSMALHAYSDAIRGEVDQIIAVTNDSDFVPAIKMIRQFTTAVVGLIAPTWRANMRVNAELEMHAHWTRTHIRDEELAASQLPPLIPFSTRAIHKPLSWYPRPDLLIPIFEEAKRIKQSAGAARKWLNRPSSYLDGRIPIDMCESDELAGELQNYMRRYAVNDGNTF